MNHRNAKSSVVLMLLLMIYVTARADGSFRALQAEHGLSDMLVNTIFKDSRGFVWLGTGTGLDRFDGNHIRNFPYPDNSSGQRRVNAIAEGPGGVIYAGTHSGLYRLAEGELERMLPEKINFKVNAIADDGSGMLYVGTAQGLFIVDTRTGTATQRLMRRDVLSSDNEISAITLSREGGLWMATRNNIHRLASADADIESWHLRHTGNISRVIEMDRKLYLGVYGAGVIEFDIDRHTFSDAVTTGNNLVTDLAPANDGSGALLVATDGDGIFSYGTGGVKHLHYEGMPGQGLRSNSIYSLMTDSQGVLWVGYYQSGLDYTPPVNDIFEVYSIPGLVDTHTKAVRAISIDGPRKLIGTRDGLYYVDENRNYAAHFQSPDIRSNIIFCITPYKGKYYVGTYNGGMYVFDPQTMSMRDFGSDEVFRSGAIFAIAEAADGSMWVGTSRGLYRFSDPGRRPDFFDASNSQLPAGNVYEIFFDSEGRGWICTENGMAVWDGKALRADRFPAGFANTAKIRDVYEDSRNDLYFVPDRGRVFKSNKALTRFGYVGKESTGYTPTVTFVIEDRDHYMWYGTEKGLIRYDGDSNFRVYNNADGLPDAVFTLCQPSTDSDGTMWFGNSHGLVKLDYNKLKQDENRPRHNLCITDVEANGQPATQRLKAMDSGFEIELSDDEAGLSVSYSNLSYTDPRWSQIQYRYDDDPEWHLKSGGDNITLYNVAHGKSRLRLRVTGDPDSETVLSIHRRGSFPWSMLAIIFSTLLAVGCVTWYIIRHQEHVREVERLTAEKATIEHEAATALEEKKKNRYRTSKLSDEECKRIMKLLDGLMKKDRPYTNPDLKISDLAALTGTSSHDLSYLFNQYLESSFYDYINGLRVEEFKRLARHIDTSRYTLSAMASMCGFSSRASFFRHFKTATGTTPAEWLKQGD